MLSRLTRQPNHQGHRHHYHANEKAVMHKKDYQVTTASLMLWIPSTADQVQTSSPGAARVDDVQSHLVACVLLLGFLARDSSSSTPAPHQYMTHLIRPVPVPQARCAGSHYPFSTAVRFHPSHTVLLDIQHGKGSGGLVVTILA